MEINDLIRHYLFLERLASGGVNSVVTPSMRNLYRDIAAALNQQDAITSQRQLNAVLSKIKQAVADTSPWSTLTDEYLQPLANYEVQWQAQFMQDSYGEPVSQVEIDTGQINNALLDLSEGKTVATWAELTKANDASALQSINSIVKRGFIRGDTIATMKREIKQTIEGVLTRNAETLARTGYAHYASEAQETITQQNKDIVDEYYYVVTFDNRISSICQSVTKFNAPSKRFKVGDSKAPKPPLHPNCRTRRIAIPKGQRPEGKRAAVGGDGGELNPTQIDSSTTYEAWLKMQPRWFVNDTLGVKRATLLLDKGVSLKKFSDMQGRPLTLAEIAQREGIKI